MDKELLEFPLREDEIPVIVTRRGATLIRRDGFVPSIEGANSSSPTTNNATVNTFPNTSPSQNIATNPNATTQNNVASAAPTNQEHIEQLSLEEKLDFFNRVVRVPVSLIEKDAQTVLEPLTKTREYEYQVATIYVKDAITGRDIHHRVDKTSLILYKFIKSFIFRVIYVLVTFILYLLFLFEEPAVWEIPFGITQSIEIIIMLFYIIQSIPRLIVYSTNLFAKRNAIPFLTIILAWITIVDIIIYFFTPFGRFTRCFRGLFLLSLTKSIQRYFSYVLYVATKMFVVVAALLTLVGLYASVGRVLFLDTKSDIFFDTVPNAIVNMMALLTTANFPDIMLDAYRVSPLYSLFFISFLFIGLYTLLNFTLALVYNFFKEVATKESISDWKMRRTALVGAFTYLDTDKKGYITYWEYVRLMRKLYPKFNKQPGKLRAIFYLCGGTMTEQLHLPDFLNIADVLHHEIVEVNKYTDLSKGKRYYWLPVFPSLQRLFGSRIYTIISQCMVLLSVSLSLFFIVINETPFEYLYQYLPQYIVFQVIDAIILAYFFVEIVLKILAYGVHRYFNSLWNVFDLFIVGIQVIAKLIVEVLLPIALPGTVTLTEKYLRWMELIRFIRMFRIFLISETVRKIISAYFEIIVLIFFFMTILGIQFTFFGSIGMELFDGALKRGDPKLLNTDYHTLNFYDVVCFDNAITTLITMIHLMVVNNWHVTAKAIMATKGPHYSIFFYVFYFSTITFVFNLLVAVIIEAFLSRWGAMREKKVANMEMQQNLLQVLEERHSARQAGISVWKLKPSTSFNTTQITYQMYKDDSLALSAFSEDFIKEREAALKNDSDNILKGIKTNVLKLFKDGLDTLKFNSRNGEVNNLSAHLMVDDSEVYNDFQRL